VKIGVDTRPLTYQLSGIGVYLKNLLEALQKTDQNNHYYLMSNGPIDFELYNAKWLKIEGKYKKKLLSTFWMQIQAPILASKLKLDFFWGPRHHLPVLLPTRIKTVVTVHDIVHRLYPKTMALPNLLVERLLMRWSLLRADCIITDSRSTTADIEKSYRVDSKKINTIHLGTPVFPKSTTVDNNTNTGLPSKYFLFVGTLEPRKNFKRILKAFELIQPETHGSHLVITGGLGWKNRAFLDSLKRHPLNHHIHLTGYVNSNQLLTFYTNALCLLFPSLYEGFGFPILEAMACGTPIITSNISSMPEVAGNAAILVDPYDISALAKAMQQIMTNGKLRERLRMKGFQRAKKFSWERCARETLNIFNTLGKR